MCAVEIINETLLETLFSNPKVVVLVGGVGGAKLAYGLSHSLPPENLTVIVNVADDFWHYGLRVCPDLDTIMYTLSERVDPVNGWGIAGDTTAMLDALRRYGEQTWFGLKDQDLATHLLRTQWLHQGMRLTDITRELAARSGLRCALLPITDDPVMTIVHTEEHGALEFQEYFVRYRWQPRVKSLEYRGASEARLTPEVRQALAEADVILFGPSNPWLSIGPMMAIPDMADLLRSRQIPRVALTPIIDGKAVKGPAAKIMGELGMEVSAQSVMDYYGDLLNGFITDERDQRDWQSQSGEASRPDSENLHSVIYKVQSFDTIMGDTQSKVKLAKKILETLQGWK